MTIDEFHHRGWRVEVPPGRSGWKALIYRPGSLLHEATMPHGPDRPAVIAEAQALIEDDGQDNYFDISGVVGRLWFESGSYGFEGTSMSTMPYLFRNRMIYCIHG